LICDFRERLAMIYMGLRTSARDCELYHLLGISRNSFLYCQRNSSLYCREPSAERSTLAEVSRHITTLCTRYTKPCPHTATNNKQCSTARSKHNVTASVMRSSLCLVRAQTLQTNKRAQRPAFPQGRHHRSARRITELVITGAKTKRD